MNNQKTLHCIAVCIAVLSLTGCGPYGTIASVFSQGLSQDFASDKQKEARKSGVYGHNDACSLYGTCEEGELKDDDCSVWGTCVAEEPVGCGLWGCEDSGSVWGDGSTGGSGDCDVWGNNC